MTIGSGKISSEVNILAESAKRELRQLQNMLELTETSLQKLSAGKKISIDAKDAEKAISGISSKLNEATQAANQMRMEHQRFSQAANDGLAAVHGLTVAFSALSTEEEEGASTLKHFENSLATTMTVAGSTQGVLSALGGAGSSLGGTLGSVVGALSRFAGPIGLVVGAGTGLIQLFSSLNQHSKKASEEGLQKFEYGLDTILNKLKQADNFSKQVIQARKEYLNHQINIVEAQATILTNAVENKGNIIVPDSVIEMAGNHWVESLTYYKNVSAETLQKWKTDAELKRRQAAEIVAELNGLGGTVTANFDLTGSKEPKQKEKESSEPVPYGPSVEGFEQAQQQEFEKIGKDMELGEKYEGISVAKAKEQYKALLEVAHAEELRYQINLKMKKLDEDDASKEEIKTKARREYDLSLKDKTEAARLREHDKIDELKKNDIISFTEAGARKAEIDKKYGEEEIARAQEVAARKQQIQLGALEQSMSLLAKTFPQVKAFAIGEAIINTYLAATKALSSAPPPFNIILMAATIAQGLAQVAKITETNPSFARGGYTGDGHRYEAAGIVHKGEVVFENPIVHGNKAELLALRAALQGGATVQGLMMRGENSSILVVTELRKLRNDMREMQQRQNIIVQGALDGQQFVVKQVQNYNKVQAVKRV